MTARLFLLIFLAVICDASFNGRKSDSSYFNVFSDGLEVEGDYKVKEYKKGNNLDASKYTADWESLDKRPLPSWYDEAKFGIFVHWV